MYLASIFDALNNLIIYEGPALSSRSRSHSSGRSEILSPHSAMLSRAPALSELATFGK